MLRARNMSVFSWLTTRQRTISAWLNAPVFSLTAGKRNARSMRTWPGNFFVSQKVRRFSRGVGNCWQSNWLSPAGKIMP
jgi:hypothetical protein